MNLRFSARLSRSIALLLLLCAARLTTGASAQDQSEVKLTARAGFDGYCKENRWIPVKVNVENSGPDLKARLQVEYANGQGGTTAYGTDLDLPTGSRKEFFLYLYPTDYLDKLNVSLSVDGRTRVKTALNITCVTNGNLLIGLLADNPSAYASLNETEPLSGFARVIQLRTSDLPDQAQGWEALDALMVAGADTGTLTGEQRSALGAWLAEGGKLLVVGGAKWQPAVAGLGEFLPADLNQTQNSGNLSALSTYFKVAEPPEGSATLATGQLRDGAQVLVAQDGLPLLVQRQIGFGSVFYLAADPGLQPLSDWDGMKTVYSHLLGVQIPRPRWTQWPWDNSATDNALAALPELGLPSFVYVCGWLVFYLVIVGPANYFLLRRFKRPELAWITIPGLVVLFTGIAYFSGFLYRGGQPTLNRLVVAQGWEGVEQARAQAVVGIYSPKRTKYTLEAATSFKFLPFGSAGATLQANNNWLALQNGQNNLLPETLVEIGGMKSVAVNGNLPALQVTHNLVVNISNNMPSLTGQVTNTSGSTIQEAFLLTPGQVTQLGDLAPGATQKINVPLMIDRNNPIYYQLNQGIVLPGNYPSTQPSETSRRRNALIQAAVMPGQYNTNPANWGIYLLGWVEAPLLPVGIQAMEFKTVDTSLLITMLTPAFNLDGDSWQITPAIFAWESTLAEASPFYSYNIPADGYSLRFRPVLPLDFSTIKSLKLTLDCAARPDQVTVSLWNYENGNWSQVDVSSWGEINVPVPDRFIGPGGEIRLKLEADQDAYTEVRESSVKLVVTP